jgi:TonB family protein
MPLINVIIDEEVKFASDYDWPGLWKGSAASLALHAGIFFLAVGLSTHKQKNDIKLTEITMVDQIIPMPEEPAPLPPPPPKEKTNVWDFLKQAVPLKQKMELASKIPLELPKKMDQPKLSAMPEALKLGDKKNMDKMAMPEALDLVGRKAVKQPAGMDINPLQMKQKTDSLAMASKMPEGISLGRKGSFGATNQMPALDTTNFGRRANLQARGGSLADMPTIKEPEKKKQIDFSTSNLSIQREQNTFQIYGDLKNRRIMQKYMPRYPRWAEEQGIECTVSIHFFVVPAGFVKDNLYIEQSSGYPEMDNLAMTALKAFQFAPLGSDERQVEQEGVIAFYFRLSR